MALIDDVPCAIALATPADDTVATVGVADDQERRRQVLRSYRRSDSGGRELIGRTLSRAVFAGVTQSDTRAAGSTVSFVEPVTPSNVALIDDVPIPSAWATPIDPDVFEIVAVPVFRRGPRHLVREVCRRVVRERTRRGELLGFPLGNARIGRRDCERFKHRSHREHRTARDSVHRGLINALPFARPAARPCEPVVLEMLATEG